MLSASEKAELDRCEKAIRNGWQSFVEVGEALLKIRDGELFRDCYAFFEDYYRDVWNYQKSQVYRLMDAAKVVRAISPIGEKPVAGLLLPTCEAQVRPLVKLADNEIKDVWQKAADQAKTNNAPITARLVQLQVRAVTPSPAEKSRRRNDVPDNKTIVFRLLDRLLKMIDPDKQAEAEEIRLQVLDLVPYVKGPNSKGKFF